MNENPLVKTRRLVIFGAMGALATFPLSKIAKREPLVWPRSFQGWTVFVPPVMAGWARYIGGGKRQG